VKGQAKLGYMKEISTRTEVPGKPATSAKVVG